jgi:tetratricopeptide (TPR) repeat protein
MITEDQSEQAQLKAHVAELSEELLDPTLENPSAVHNNLANTLMKLGSIMDAIKHYRQALEITEEKDPAILMNMGVAFKHLHRYDDAVKYFRKSLQIRPTADEHYNLANTLLKLPDADMNEAIQHYKECLKLDGDHSSAHMNLGTALKQSGHIDGAIIEFRCALKLIVSDFKTHYNLANALVAKAEADESKGMPQAKMDALLQEAAAQYEQAIELNPSDADARTNLSIILQRMNRSEEAVAHYLEIMNLKPGDFETHYNCGNALWSMVPPNREGAIMQYKEALVLNPEHLETVYNLANVLMESEEWEESITTFEIYVSDMADDEADVFYKLGGLYGKVGKDDKAREALEKCIELDPENDLAHLNLGNHLAKVKEPTLAVAQYQAAIKINALNSNAHKNLAFTLVEEGDLEAGLVSLDKFLEIVPGDEEALMYKDDIKRMLGAADKISADIAETKKVVDENPSNLAGRAKLAQLYQANDQHDEAIEQFEACLALQPGHPKLTDMLNRCKQELAYKQPVALTIADVNASSIANGSSKFFEEDSSDTGMGSPMGNRGRADSSASNNSPSPTHRSGGGFGMFGGKKKGRKMSNAGIKKGASGRDINKVGVSG